MQLTIIIWTIFCAMAIIIYPFFLFNSAIKNSKSSKDDIDFYFSSIKLFSFDLKDRPAGWSFTIEIPEFTEDILFNHPILFYLETEETCLKLPVFNETLGYSANIFKSIGKAYLTFKCIKDGVSNYNAPMCHLKSLKVLILKPNSISPKSGSIYTTKKYTIHNLLGASQVNIHDYENTLEYLSNFCEIDFQGYRKKNISLLSDSKTDLVEPPKIESEHSVHLI